MTTEEQDDERYAESQSMIKWINKYLSQRGMSVSNLEKDFADGVLLCVLIELCFGAKIRFKANPKQMFQKIGNITTCLDFMKQNLDFKQISIESKDIMEGKIKLIFIVLYYLLRSRALMDIKTLSPTISETSTDIRDSLKKWINEIPNVNITDYWSSFQDGKTFLHILNQLVPGQLDLNSFGEPEANLQKAFEFGEEKLGIPIFIPIDFLKKKIIDEQPIVNYLCMLISSSQATEAKLKEIKDLREKLQLERQEKEKEKLKKTKEEQKAYQDKQAKILANVSSTRKKMLEQRIEAERKFKQMESQKEEEIKKLAEKRAAEEQVLNEQIKAAKDDSDKKIAQLQMEFLDKEKEAEKAHLVQLETLKAELKSQKEEMQNEIDQITTEAKAHQENAEHTNAVLKTTIDEVTALTAKNQESQHKIEENDETIASLNTELYELHREHQDVLHHFNKTEVFQEKISSAHKKGHDISVLLNRAHKDTLNFDQYMSSLPSKEGPMEKVNKLDKKPTPIYVVIKENKLFIKKKKEDKDGSFHNLSGYLPVSQDMLNKKLIHFVPSQGLNQKEFFLNTKDDFNSWVEFIETRIALSSYMHSILKENVRKFPSREMADIVAKPNEKIIKIYNSVGTDFADAIKHFANVLIFRKDLQISLQNCAIKDECIEPLGLVITKSPSLIKLDLEKNLITGQGCTELAKALKKNKSMKTLVLDNNPLIKDTGLIRLGLVLSEHPTITHFSFRACGITGKGIEQFIDAFLKIQTKTKNPHTVKSIIFDDNNLGDDGAKAVAKWCSLNPNIQDISLNHCGISDDGVKYFADEISSGKIKLQIMSLEGNKISSNGALFLADALKVSCPVELNLSNNVIARKGVSGLVNLEKPLMFTGLKIEFSQQ